MKKQRVSSSTSGIACFVVCLFLFIIQIRFGPLGRLRVTTTKPYLENHLHQQELRVEVDKINLTEVRHRPRPLTSCDRRDIRYDLCKINGPTLLDPTTATFYVSEPNGPIGPKVIEKIRPYPRKYEDFVMGKIRDVTIETSGPMSPLGPLDPKCEVRHGPPALVFSAGGYTGNFFHDFNDGFIPLFITVNTIFPDRDFVIVVSESPNWWALRYKGLLETFSKHPIITLKNDTATHCFPNATLGLISHGFMTINQTLLPNSKNLLHFRSHIDMAFGKTHHPISTASRGRKPRLVLASRGRGIGRRILNEPKLIRMMEKIGFEVIVFQPRAQTLFQESYALINSSHVMVGVHGAALTHSLFLRPGSAFIQIVPVGVDWAANAFFGSVGHQMKLEYMEYKIEADESSLVKKYGKDNVLVKSPYEIQNKGWPTDAMDIYLKEQEVNLNLKRFRGYLKKAYQTAKKFMDREG